LAGDTGDKNQLHTSRNKLVDFLDQFQGVAYQVYVNHPRFRLLYGKVEEISGYSMENFLEGNISWDNLIHPGDFPRVKEEGKKLAENPRYVADDEYRLLRKDGSVRWVRDIKKCLETEEGKIIQGAVYDITDRKEIEENLRQSEERYRSLVEHANDAITVSQDNKFKFANPAALKMTGYTEEEMYSLPISNFVHPKDREMVIERYHKRLRGEETPSQYQIRVITREGNIKWAEINSVKIAWNHRPAVLSFFTDITEQKQFEEALRASEEIYRNVVEHANDGIIISQNLKIKLANSSILDILGYTEKEVLETSISRYLDPEEFNRAYYFFQEQTSKNEEPGVFETVLQHKNGREVPAELNMGALEYQGKPAYLIIIRDITQRKQAEQKLSQQKQYFEALFKNSPEAIALVDTKKKIVDINERFATLFDYKLEEIKGNNIDTLLSRGKDLKSARYFSEQALQGKNIEEETIRYDRRERPRSVHVKGIPVYLDGEIVGCYGVYSDISKRKRYEKQLQNYSLYDQLTELYNRNFFEEELNRLQKSREYPISIISADLDGLKLINDTMGHKVGDEYIKNCASLMKKSFRQSDILARVGGDEFASILTYTDEEEAKGVAERIRKHIKEYNDMHQEFPLSISLGTATAYSPAESLEEAYKQADDRMYHDKLLHSSEVRNRMMEGLMGTLSERDFLSQGHDRRVARLCQAIAEKANLSLRQQNDLQLLARVHDLGKVGIPDRILFKKGPLTPEEREIVNQHSEKGYRIALSSPDLARVADLILKHHEHWDGSGYPLGIEGKEIPLECRILAIADAFDAMTHPKDHRESLSREKAMEEIKNHAGTQFDPGLVELFLEVMEEEQQQERNKEI